MTLNTDAKRQRAAYVLIAFATVAVFLIVSTCAKNAGTLLNQIDGPLPSCPDCIHQEPKPQGNAK